MPSQATNYFFTIVTMGVVALLVTNAFKVHAIGIKAASEQQELKRLLEAVATEATELVALTEATNASTKISLHTPTLIGNKEYWIRLYSSGSESWIEGAFGDPWAGAPDGRVELPWDVSASGTYHGGNGTLSLYCTMQASTLTLTLAKWEGG